MLIISDSTDGTIAISRTNFKCTTASRKNIAHAPFLGKIKRNLICDLEKVVAEIEQIFTATKGEK